MLRSEAAVGGVIRLSTVTEPDVPWQGELAHTTEHTQIRLEQGEQALRAIFMHLTPCVFLLRMIDGLVLVARQRPIATGRVRVELTACLHRNVGSLLDRLHREIFGRLDDDSPLATDPGDNRGPVFVIVPPTGLTLLAAPPRAASQRLLPTLLRLPLVARGVVEVIRFHCACELAM